MNNKLFVYNKYLYLVLKRHRLTRTVSCRWHLLTRRCLHAKITIEVVYASTLLIENKQLFETLTNPPKETEHYFVML